MEFRNMHRRGLQVLVLLLLFAGYAAMGQNVTFGPRIGFTTSHLSTNQDTVLDEFRQGFEGGVFLRFYGDYFYFQPEVMYVTKGGIFNTETESFKQEIELQSVDVPVIFGVILGPPEFNFRLHGGPVASFIIDKSVTVSGTGMTSAISKHNIKDSMLGTAIGLGLDILSFSLDVRYEFGWDNMYQKDSGDPDIEWKHEMFNVSLAIKLL